MIPKYLIPNYLGLGMAHGRKSEMYEMVMIMISDLALSLAYRSGYEKN